MPAKTKSKPKVKAARLALPARMRIETQNLANLEIALLDFPFAQALERFVERISNFIDLKPEHYPPFRLLNNAILAYSSVTQGFEKKSEWGKWWERRMLAIGQPVYVDGLPTNVAFNYPSIADLTQEMIKPWLERWAEQPWLKTLIAGLAKDAWDELMAALGKTETKWERLKVQELVEDLENSHDKLGYQAIARLLMTMLHEKTSQIGGKTVIWRKALRDGTGPDGLFLVSRPFKVIYQTPSGKQRQGYFAYRVDFSVQTQAGRFNAQGNLEPWIFVRLSCQRYAGDTLTKINPDRKPSILVGLNAERLDNSKTDSALVRLATEKRDGKWQWLEGLSKLLEAFQIKSLVEPEKIMQSPDRYANFDNDPAFGNQNEYYIVHAEGYKYGPRRAKHSIMTGSNFKERHEVMGQLLQHFQGILNPDAPFQVDPVKPKRGTALKPFAKHSSNILSEATGRMLKDRPMQVLLIYRHDHERELLEREIHIAYRLAVGGSLPAGLKIIPVEIKDINLTQALSRGEFTSNDHSKKNYKTHLIRQHNQRREEWRKFLGQTLQGLPKTMLRFAIVALPAFEKDNDEDEMRRSVLGPLREACALEGISSQVVRGILKLEKPKKGRYGRIKTDYDDEVVSRVKNAVYDALVRQPGLMADLPSHIYETAGLPPELAQQLDLVGFCRLISREDDIHYALATRLRPDSTLEVLLPHDRQNWIPYELAGPVVGKIFSEARSDARDRYGKRVNSKVKLENKHLAQFVVEVLTMPYQNPTLALIEADVWRNGGGDKQEYWIWPQLKNSGLTAQRHELDFRARSGASFALLARRRAAE